MTVILMPEIDCNIYKTAASLTIGIKPYLQITLSNENHSFLSEQLTEDDTKINDSDNERFLSDQCLHFTMLRSERSPRLNGFHGYFV